MLIPNANKKKTVEPVALLKTYMIQFMYKDGNGWALVNAATVKQAESVFKTQTKYENAVVISTKEIKYCGNNMQIVFEGAVTTIPTVVGRVVVDKNDYDVFMSFVGEELDKYYTKEEIEDLIKDTTIEVDLSNYYKKSETYDKTTIDDKIASIEVPEVDLSGYYTKDETFTKQEVDDLIDEKITEYNPGGEGGQTIININGEDLPDFLTTTIKRGTYEEAYNEATKQVEIEGTQVSVNLNTVFAWLLEDSDDNNNTITKVIYHIGNGQFIDALGARVIGKVSGITIY